MSSVIIELKNIDNLLLISGGRIQLADLQRSSNHSGWKKDAVCLPPADEVLHGPVGRLLRSSQTSPPPRPKAFDLWCHGWPTSVWRHPAPRPPWRVEGGREGGWWVVLFHIIHTSTDRDWLWSWPFKEPALFVRAGGQQVTMLRHLNIILVLSFF